MFSASLKENFSIFLPDLVENLEVTKGKNTAERLAFGFEPLPICKNGEQQSKTQSEYFESFVSWIDTDFGGSFTAYLEAMCSPRELQNFLHLRRKYPEDVPDPAQYVPEDLRGRFEIKPRSDGGKAYFHDKAVLDFNLELADTQEKETLEEARTPCHDVNDGKMPHEMESFVPYRIPYYRLYNHETKQVELVYRVERNKSGLVLKKHKQLSVFITKELGNGRDFHLPTLITEKVEEGAWAKVRRYNSLMREYQWLMKVRDVRVCDTKIPVNWDGFEKRVFYVPFDLDIYGKQTRVYLYSPMIMADLSVEAVAQIDAEIAARRKAKEIADSQDINSDLD